MTPPRPPLRATYTYVTLAVPREMHALVEERLRAAGYGHAIDDEGLIDMHGLALVVDEQEDNEADVTAG